LSAGPKLGFGGVGSIDSTGIDATSGTKTETEKEVSSAGPVLPARSRIELARIVKEKLEPSQPTSVASQTWSLLAVKESTWQSLFELVKL
jgi:hypothetical protein